MSKCKKPCNTCPFRKDTTNYGAIEWIVDIINGIRHRNLSHSCHVTDPKADGYKAGKPTKCWGFLGMMKNFKNECIDPEVNSDIFYGRLDWKDVPTEGIFCSPRELADHHLKGWEQERAAAKRVVV